MSITGIILPSSRIGVGVIVGVEGLRVGDGFIVGVGVLAGVTVTSTYIISGVGVRAYYRSLGYHLDGSYMVKRLA